jgi:hypothetical protein
VRALGDHITHGDAVRLVAKTQDRQQDDLLEFAECRRSAAICPAS